MSNASPSANARVEPAAGDLYDQPYRFGKPLSYLSERQQVRLLVLRGKLQEKTAIPATHQPV